MENIKNQRKEITELRTTISKLMDVPETSITRIQYLTKGMTNHSFRFF